MSLPQLPKDFCDLRELAELKFDLRYATTNNICQVAVYSPDFIPALHKSAFDKLKIALQILRQEVPLSTFVIFDAFRPLEAQKKFFAMVEGTDQEIYFANPKNKSIHNFGYAVDLTLADKQSGELWDMGTDFDDFRDEAQPVKEDEMLRLGRLNEKQIQNRKILRDIMVRAGFQVLPIEWWHFDAEDPKWVRANAQAY